MLEQKDLEMIAEIVAKKMEPIKKDLKEIQLTLENETNRNIKIVAEGHLDLSRKLDEALNVENEKEMLLVRVNILESDVRRLKEKVATIAKDYKMAQRKEPYGRRKILANAVFLNFLKFSHSN